ncbi:MAG: Ig-like domain-containing protein, partial [Polyangiales bacterium]
MMSTIRSFGRPAFYAALCLLTFSLIAGCKGKASSRGKAEDGGLSDASQAPGKDGGGKSNVNLLKAPEAQQVGMLMLDEPVSGVVHVADLALSLHSTSGVSILDMSDPSAPKVISRLPTTGRAVGVAYDVELRILFIITVSGDLRAYRVGDVTMPVQASQSTITEPDASGDTITGLVRIGTRLFALGQSHLLPVSVLYGASGSVGFLALDAVQLDADPQLISSGGDSLYIAFKGGGVQVWSSGDAPAMTDKASLGANVVGWVVRGSRLFVVLEGRGLRVIDMTVTGKLSVLFDAPDFNDATALARFGNLVLTALSRGLLVALDLTALDAPRALVTRSGSLPDWISAVSGNLLLGSGKQLQVFGIPPFVSATVPKVLRGGFPRYGRIPVQLSKPVDPTTVTVDNVKLLCSGTAVDGTVVVSLDGLHITFLPKGDLPAGATCLLDLGGVKDLLGLSLSVPQVAPALTFNTMTQAPAAVDNKKSGYAHTADGQLTDWTAGKTKDFEYFDVTPARGMYSYFYADHDGTRLWMLNDWFYNGDKIDPDCFNQFGVWTGGGTERWDIRAYGDQHIEVRLNGTLLTADDKRVSGGYSHGASPNQAEPHTMYEISVQTAPGAWGVQLHDPGPTYGCDQLETDPTTYNATSTAMGSS